MKIIDYGLISPSKDVIPFGPEQAAILEQYREALDDLIIKGHEFSFKQKTKLMAESQAVVKFLRENKTWD